MGKGDIKSKKGKLANGSFGNSRRRNETAKKSEPVIAVAEKEGSKSRIKKSRELNSAFFYMAI